MSCAAKGIIGARRKRQCASTGVLFNHDVRALASAEKMWLRPVVRKMAFRNSPVFSRAMAWRSIPGMGRPNHLRPLPPPRKGGVDETTPELRQRTVECACGASPPAARRVAP